MNDHLSSPQSGPSDRKKSEELFHLYDLLIRYSRDIILFVRPEDGRILEANVAAETAYGHTRDRLRQMTVQDLRADGSLPAIARQLADGEPRGVLFETVHRRKDGALFPVEVSSRGARIQEKSVLVSIIRDITERKRVEQTLRDTHSFGEFHQLQLNALINQMTEGLVVFDPRGNLLGMNPAALAIHGLDSVANLQRQFETLTDVFQLFDLEGNPLPTEAWPIGRVLRGETFGSYEVRVRRIDTGKNWVASYGGAPVRDREGNLLLAIVTLRNITEQKVMEDALRISELRAHRSAREADERRAQLQVLIENSPMEVALADAGGNILYVNPELLKRHGFSSGEEFRLGFDRLAEAIENRSPDGRLLPVSEWPMMRALRGETIQGMEIGSRNRLTGEEWISLVHATPVFDEGGNVSYVVIVRQDITGIRKAEITLRESEERLRLALEAGRMGTWDWEVGTSRVEWSEGFFTLMGYRAGEVEPNYAAFRNRIHPEDVEDRNRAMREAMKGRKEYACEYRVVWPDGSVHWVEARGRFTYDHRGEAIRMYGVLSDIDHRKQAEQELRNLNAELERRVAERTAEAENRARQLQQLALELSDAEDRERRKIAMILHDDLQQYLAAIHFGLEALLPKERIDADIRERTGYLHHLIDNSIRKCRDLSHELSPPVLHQIGLLPALEWLASDIEKKHGIEVTLRTEPDAEPESPVLASMLYRSIKELLFNSVKYSGTDTAVVDARSEDDHLRIRVGDSGRGCDVAELKSKRGKEVGFGLFSIEERIHFLGGRVEIDSAPGHGFRVTLHIPDRGIGKPADLALGTVFKDAAETPADAETPAQAEKIARIRVLLADDHAVMREGLANLLAGEADIKVVAQAENGRQAVDLTDELKPEVVLMDVTMPIMDGIEATARIHETRPETRIIGLSMHDDPVTRERMIEAGASAYVCKGDAARRLIEEIRRVARGQG